MTTPSDVAPLPDWAKSLQLPYWEKAIEQQDSASITEEEKMMLSGAEEAIGQTFIYFVCAPQLNLIKVGHTSDCRKRYSELRSANACELVPYFEIEAPRTFERIILRLLASSKSHHEWLHLNTIVGAMIECIQDYDIWHNETRRALRSSDICSIVRCWELLIEDRGINDVNSGDIESNDPQS